jgi:hypothetical protein
MPIKFTPASPEELAQRGVVAEKPAEAEAAKEAKPADPAPTPRKAKK